MTVLIITSVCLAPSMSRTPSKSFTCIFSWELSSLGQYYYYFLKFLCCILVLSFEVLRCVIVSWFQKVLFALCALNALTTTVCLVAAALRYLQIFAARRSCIVSPRKVAGCLWLHRSHPRTFLCHPLLFSPSLCSEGCWLTEVLFN